MQTVFPWLFTVDPLGWAGGAQYIASFDPNAEYDASAYHKMQEYIEKGSKFQHLQSKTTNWNGIDKGFYILVPLQLPHDDTIKFHSDFSVEEFVTSICQWVVDTDVDYQIVFKGHPVNVKSMEPLKEIIEKFREDGDRRVKDRLTYIEQGNFHELVNNSVGMFVLNGGSGQEAMLLEKPVVCFGKCDYAPAVIQGSIDNIDGTYKDMISDDWTERMHMYERWFDWYVNEICIDTKA
jgi:capsule polysaccharide modification protein KpsS